MFLKKRKIKFVFLFKQTSDHLSIDPIGISVDKILKLIDLMPLKSFPVYLFLQKNEICFKKRKKITKVSIECQLDNSVSFLVFTNTRNLMHRTPRTSPTHVFCISYFTVGCSTALLLVSSAIWWRIERKVLENRSCL